MKLQNVSDIPTSWKVLTVRKKTTVKIRAAEVVESFKVSWQDAELVSDPDLDLIVIQPNGAEYPCKTDIFFETYQPAPNQYGSGFGDWIKGATTTLVEIPEGETVEIHTLEGILPAISFPDFIAIGPKGELYANTREFFDKNLEVV